MIRTIGRYDIRGRSLLLQIFATLVLVCVIAPNAQAQYQFDVKTKLSEKNNLHIIKIGLIHTINESSWASVGDIGEDYSLWLTDLRRVQKQDSMYVVIKVELRTKAMFTSGMLIHGRDVGIRYHLEKSMAYTKDNAQGTSPSEKGAQIEEGVDDSAPVLRGLMSLAAGLEFAVPVSLKQITSKMAKQVMREMASLTKQNPSPIEMMEALLIGDQTLQVVKGMITSD
ncbi:MAG: hypothetical protein HN521_22500 [Candidatus Latescibacteria bacterium]|jgi:hypothetical protein|nr:hypothetical protein [Candidatus Latescibacterota bacterium]